MKKSKNTLYAISFVIILMGVGGYFFYSTQNNSALEKPVEVVEVKTAADELGPNETKFDADNFDKEVLESDKPVLVDFYTSTCGHCIQSAPIFTETSNLLEDQVKFGKLEIRKNREYIDKYKIEGTPTFVLFKDGKEVARREGGNVTVEDFKTFINTSLNKNTPAA